MTVAKPHESQDFVRTLSKGYAALILIILGLTPSFAIAYLHFFQDSRLLFEHHVFHEVAIGVSLVQSGFITYVTWRCYQHSGEPFLRWLTLGFLGFTVIYGLHGVFTRYSHENVWAFILYGPASRLVMAGCLLAGLLVYGRQAQSIAQRSRGHYWLAWIGVFVGINVLVFVLANSTWAPAIRWAMEVSAMCLMLVCAATIFARRIRSPLMTVFALSLLIFSQSSLAFLVGTVWTHQWWLAHAVFAAGFMALSYGVIHAFLTTGSFTTVYSQVELMERIKTEKERAEGALLELQRAHRDLEILAATDSLTGATNRREFATRAAAEITRATRSGAPLSVLVVDLDRFKQINDRYGHQAGDEVLRVFVETVRKGLRPNDLIGRLGGEEFGVMLPDTTRAGAGRLAERLRHIVENQIVTINDAQVRLTASFGAAQLGLDGNTYESMIDAADGRMYRAKQDGRNMVVAQ